jgi:hypothetical protein
MDWSGHVQAILSEWILRWIMPPDRDVCAWKHVLYQMIFVDKRGYDKFPEGREIFFCKMTKADIEASPSARHILDRVYTRSGPST